MLTPEIRQYGAGIGIGAGLGALAAALMKNAQFWRSPHGGTIACVYAQRVASNPLNINAGLQISFSATVPQDYALAGRLVPDKCSFQVLLVSCVCLGFLLGAYYAYNALQKTAEEDKQTS